MQRKLLFFACTLLSVHSYAQQYPFVHYTPKDGLVNSRCRKAFQDSFGRMYFLTFGGLSVYDGSKFTNYTTEQGLCNNVVNDIYEAGPDSFLVATNGTCLNTLVRNKIGILSLGGGSYPVINQFLKSQNGKLYLLSDKGLFILNGDQLIPELPGREKTGELLHKGIEWKNYLIMIPWDGIKDKIILYDKNNQKIIHTLSQPHFLGVADVGEGMLIATTVKGQFILDTAYLKKGKLHLIRAPDPFNRPDQSSINVYVTSSKDTWLFTHNETFQYKKKVLQSIIHPEQQLSISNIRQVYTDRENILWVITEGSGVYKFPNTDIQFFETSFPGNFSGVSSIYTSSQTDTAWFYQFTRKKLAYSSSKTTGFFRVNPAPNVNYILVNNPQAYFLSSTGIYRTPYPFPKQAAIANVLMAASNNINETFGAGTIDPYGNLVIMRKINNNYYLNVFINNKLTSTCKLNFIVDGMSFDSHHHLWVVTRGNELIQFRLHPGQPDKYFELVHNFKNELELTNPRSLLVDRNDDVWVGTRFDGLHYLKMKQSRIISHQRFSTKTGLTDNFVYNITSDTLNNIWAGTQNGIDKISWSDTGWIIENVTRNNNIFQTVTQMAASKNNTVWGMTNTGSIIKINPTQRISTKPPPLLFTSIRAAGQPLIDNTPKVFKHHQNNFTFSLATASFIDEKSIQYSYLLRGSLNEQWSEPGNSSTFNFANLAPGEYNLYVKAIFPGSVYPPQTTSFSFSILSPYWETWWFRSVIVAMIAGLTVVLLRSYFKRKLQKEKLVLEKQQAIGKERTRIATDIHDDLGSGLSRIRYLGEMLKEKTVQQKSILPDLEKISAYSDEMVDKMNEIVWALNEKNDTLAALVYYTRSFTVGYLSENNLQCEVNLPEEIPVCIINGETRRNIFLAVKESLHNIVKHAQASEAEVNIAINQNIVIEIHDNGKGINWEKIKTFSNGISNIKKRMEEVGGAVAFTNHQGTKVTLTIPLL